MWLSQDSLCRQWAKQVAAVPANCGPCWKGITMKVRPQFHLQKHLKIGVYARSKRKRGGLQTYPASVVFGSELQVILLTHAWNALKERRRGGVSPQCSCSPKLCNSPRCATSTEEGTCGCLDYLMATKLARGGLWSWSEQQTQRILINNLYKRILKTTINRATPLVLWFLF